MTVLDDENGKRGFYLILSSTIQILTADIQKKTHMYIDIPQKDLIKMSVHMKGSQKYNNVFHDKNSRVCLADVSFTKKIK